jgi:hypothetical protein
VLRRRPLLLACVSTLLGPSCGNDAGGRPAAGDDGAAVVDDDIADVDGDGFAVDDGDCDDRNRSVYPGARERPRDDVDADCDGQDDPVQGEDLFDQALPMLDTDLDGAISLDEFAAACADSAMVVGEARPGVVLTQAVCSGTNQCRGMQLYEWGELVEHDCRGVNYCSGWSCVETAVDDGSDGPAAFAGAECTACHSAGDGAFALPVGEGADVDAALAAFAARSDDQWRASIAFGIAGQHEGVAYQHMPAFYDRLSRRAIDALVGYVRTLEPQASTLRPGGQRGPVRPGDDG